MRIGKSKEKNSSADLADKVFGIDVPVLKEEIEQGGEAKEAETVDIVQEIEQVEETTHVEETEEIVQTDEIEQADKIVGTEPVEETEQVEEDESLVLQTIIGFENTQPIAQELKTMIDNHGVGIVNNTMQFVGFLNDYLPDYDRERRLLVSCANIGVVKNMLAENDKKIAVMRARNTILDELFVTENACEFAIACYTYMLGWTYKSALCEEDEDEVEEPEVKATKQLTILDVEAKVLSKLDTYRYRLSRRIAVPEGYTKLDDFCFDSNTWMRTIDLPSTVLAIGAYAFSGCKHLKAIVLPERIRRIESSTFSQCADLTMVKIPNGVLEINDNAFSFCTKLANIEIPATVSSIGMEAFSCCENIKKLYLPESIKFIDVDAFLNCSNLTVYCYENSYVHKYCIKNNINVKTAVVGVDLHTIDADEGEE